MRDLRRTITGFTLLELLVASMIFAMLFLVLHSLLSGALGLRNKAYKNAETGMPREQIAQVLRRDLQNMVAPSGILAGAIVGTATKEKDNEQDSVDFYSTNGAISEGEPWADIQEVTYSLEDPSDGRDPQDGMDFVRKVKRDLLSTEDEEEDDLSPWIMMRGVKSLTLSYWDGETWQEAWDSTAQENANPKAVSLSVEFVNASADEKAEGPLEVMCEIAQQPRPTPSGSASGSASSPTPTPSPTPKPTPTPRLNPGG